MVAVGINTINKVCVSVEGKEEKTVTRPVKSWEIMNSIPCNRKIISVHINVQMRPNILCEYKCFFQISSDTFASP